MFNNIPISFIIFSLLLIRPLTVFFHEMGHAVAGWYVTRKKVLVYIGSYGNKEKSIRIPLKYFEFYIFKNPFKWGKGLCSTEEKKISIRNQILFVLCGPLASLFIALISFLTIYLTDSENFFLILLLVSSVIDFFTNIIPSGKTIQLEGGRTTINDGQNLINLFKLRKLPIEFSEGAELYQEKKYVEATKIFEDLLNKNQDSNIYRMAIISNFQNRNFDRAKELADEFRKKHKKLTSDDFTNIGLTYTETRNLKESLELYDESLKINPKNKFALNNKGYSLMLLENFETSISYFDKAISIDKKFSYAYNNRGLAKIKTMLLEEGRKDIEYSLELDSTNSDAYKNLGMYHYEKGEFETALKLYEKAKEMDANTYLIHDLIVEAQNKIAS